MKKGLHILILLMSLSLLVVGCGGGNNGGSNNNNNGGNNGGGDNGGGNSGGGDNGGGNNGGGDNLSGTTLSYPGAEETVAWGINDSGTIVGYYATEADYYTDTDGKRSAHFHGFSYDGSQYIPIDIPGTELTSIYKINNSGEMAGTLLDATRLAYGFLRRTNGSEERIDNPSDANVHSGIAAYGINNAGTVVGSFQRLGLGDNFSGYLYADGETTLVDNPAVAKDIWFYDINDSGQIVGYYDDAAGKAHGFRWDSPYNNSSFTTIDCSGAVGVQLAGINDSGKIVGVYSTTTEAHGFLYDDGVCKPFNYTGATMTAPTEINNEGQIVGVYYDTADKAHGFLLDNPDL